MPINSITNYYDKRNSKGKNSKRKLHKSYQSVILNLPGFRKCAEEKENKQEAQVR